MIGIKITRTTVIQTSGKARHLVYILIGAAWAKIQKCDVLYHRGIGFGKCRRIRHAHLPKPYARY